MAERLQRHLVVGAVALLSVVWGTQYLVIRVVRDDASAEAGVALRFLLVAVVGQALVVATGARAPQGRALERIAVGACQAGSMLLLYRAERFIESAWASVLMATTPLFVVAFAAGMFPNERATPRVVSSLVVGFGGVLLFVGPLRGDVALSPVLALLGAALLAALAKVAARRLSPGVSPSVMLRDLGVVVLVIVAPFSWQGGLQMTSVGLAAHAYLGVVASAAATGVYFWLLARVPLTKLAYLPFSSAGVGVVVGLCAGERLAPFALLGAAAVFAGGLLLAWPESTAERGRHLAQPGSGP